MFHILYGFTIIFSLAQLSLCWDGLPGGGVVRQTHQITLDTH